MTVALSVHAAAHRLEQVGGEELIVVGGASGVAGDLVLELADERVPVDPVNTDPHVSSR